MSLKKYLAVVFVLIPLVLYANITSLFDVGLAARPLGMGTAFTSVSDDVSSVFWNPAGIVKAKKLEVLLNYNMSFLDIKNYFVAFSYSLPILSIAGGFVSRVIDDIEKTDQSSILGKFSYNDGVVLLVLSKNIFNIFSLGIRSKFLYQTIDTFSSNGFGVDIGLLTLKELPNIPVVVGVSFVNVFSIPMKGVSYWDHNVEVKDELPFRIRAGISLNSNILTPSLDIELAPTESNVFRIYFGFEKKILKIFSLRAGIKKQDLENNYSILDGLSFGSSVNLSSFCLDYSLVNTEVFGFSHSISLRLKI